MCANTYHTTELTENKYTMPGGIDELFSPSRSALIFRLSYTALVQKLFESHQFWGVSEVLQSLVIPLHVVHQCLILRVRWS